VTVGRLMEEPEGEPVAAGDLAAAIDRALTGYDFLAFAYIGKSLRRVHVAAASFLAYAISNNVGMAMLSGASVRYRFYTRWGVTAEELSRIVFSYSVTFWLGLFALGGLSLIVSPIPDGAGAPARTLLVMAGTLLMAVPPAYLALTMMRRTPLRIRRIELFAQVRKRVSAHGPSIVRRACQDAWSILQPVGIRID